jgi:hypothetical protein
LNIL